MRNMERSKLHIKINSTPQPTGFHLWNNLSHLSPCYHQICLLLGLTGNHHLSGARPFLLHPHGLNVHPKTATQVQFVSIQSSDSLYKHSKGKYWWIHESIFIQIKTELEKKHFSNKESFLFTFPFIAAMASLASSALSYFTKPKPRDFPVSLSRITSTEMTKQSAVENVLFPAQWI